MKKIFALIVSLAFLAGCESFYYDMVMDNPEQGKRGKDDLLDRANDASHVSRYR